MSKIESKKVVVPASSNAVHDFLCDMHNIEKLLPAGKYSDWKSDGKSCSFKVQGAYNIGLIFVSSEPAKQVKYESSQGSPFPFTLSVHMDETSGSTASQLFCDAQINPFLEMMVKSPLKNLFDYMADKLIVQFPAV